MPERRFATPEHLEKFMRLITSEGPVPNPTSVYRLQPATVEEFVALGEDANLAVYRHFSTRKQPDRELLEEWMDRTAGQDLHNQLGWILDELRHECSKKLITLPLDRSPDHFLSRRGTKDKVDLMVLEPGRAGPRWVRATWTPVVPLHTATVMHALDMYVLVAAPESFQKAWCTAADPEINAPEYTSEVIFDALQRFREHHRAMAEHYGKQ